MVFIEEREGREREESVGRVAGVVANPKLPEYRNLYIYIGNFFFPLSLITPYFSNHTINHARQGTELVTESVQLRHRKLKRVIQP